MKLTTLLTLLLLTITPTQAEINIPCITLEDGVYLVHQDKVYKMVEIGGELLASNEWMPINLICKGKIL